MAKAKNISDLLRDKQRLRDKLPTIASPPRCGLVERNQPGQGGPGNQWSRHAGFRTFIVTLAGRPFRGLQQAAGNQGEVGGRPHVASGLDGETAVGKTAWAAMAQAPQ